MPPASLAGPGGQMDLVTPTTAFLPLTQNPTKWWVFEPVALVRPISTGRTSRVPKPARQSLDARQYPSPSLLLLSLAGQDRHRKLNLDRTATKQRVLRRHADPKPTRAAKPYPPGQAPERTGSDCRDTPDQAPQATGRGAHTTSRSAGFPHLALSCGRSSDAVPPVWLAARSWLTVLSSA